MTKRKATHRIRKLRIGEISFVDEGDNPGAEVLITKRRLTTGAELRDGMEAVQKAAAELLGMASGEAGDEGVEKAFSILGDMNMDIDELNERIEKLAGDIETVTKRAEDAEARADKAEADLAALVEKSKAGGDKDGSTDQDDEAVLKSLPEPIRKRLIDAEAQAKAATEAVEKARDERELGEAVEKVKGLGVENADELGALLHRVNKGRSTAEDGAKLVELIEKSKAVAEGGKVLFDAIGKAKGKDAAPGDAEGKLEAAIEAIQKAKPSLTREQAYTEALDANPELYDQIAKRHPATVDAE